MIEPALIGMSQHIFSDEVVDGTARHAVEAGNNIRAANDNRSSTYIGTYRGRFYPFAPKPEDVDIRDIAHGLANICRYTGACETRYSVAEHSILIARWLLPRFGSETALAGLLHDAPEALSGFGDVARPSKLHAPIIKQTENAIWELAVAPAFGIGVELPAEVHEADSRIIADEMAQNMHESDPEYTDPLGVSLELWSPSSAEMYFLHTFDQLMAMRRVAA